MKNQILEEIERVNGANTMHLCDQLNIELSECISLIAELDDEDLVKYNTVSMQWQLET